jgi:hypothetical protein
MAEWRRALLKSLGAKPTQQNLQFLSTWQRWEGGHTHNRARFNWLNTTRGEGESINSVGVKRYRSFGEGIQFTADTLRNGKYDDVLAALQSGDPFKARPTAGLSTWVSGSPTARMDYAAKVLGEAVEQSRPSRASAPASPRLKPGPKPTRFEGDWDAMLQLVFDDDPEWLSIMQTLPDPFATTTDTGPIPDRKKGHKHEAHPVPETVLKGNKLNPGMTWQGTHVTDNLDWNGGRKTARDIMAKAGTVVVAPEAGRIIRHGGAQGGESMYFLSDKGHLYWLGHIDSMLPVGSRVKRGQGIARISSDHAAPHLHIDRYYGKNPGRYT